MEFTNEEKDLCQKLRDRMANFSFEDKEFLTRDYHLMRFLRARNMDLDKAEDMYRKQVEWRIENDLINAPTWNIANDMKENMRYQITGFTHVGDMVLFSNAGKWDPKLFHGRYDELIKVIYYVLEDLTLIYKYLTLEQCRPPKSIIVLNLDGLSFAHVTCVEWIRAAILTLKCFEAYFPEMLEVAYILNAPRVFSMVWTIVKPFISTNTHKRIQFLGNDKKTWMENFTKFMDEDQIPVAFGGTLHDDYELTYENGKLQPNQGCNSNSADKNRNTSGRDGKEKLELEHTFLRENFKLKELA